MPKLLLLGTNDRYWTVDSLRHYWNDLPEPKLIFQTPNAGHDLGGGRDAVRTLAAFFESIADGYPLPKMEWKLEDKIDGTASATVRITENAKAIRLWTAVSGNRDFRQAKWRSRTLKIQPGRSHAAADVKAPPVGYLAYLMEVEVTSPTGHPFKLSTEARVTPDNIR